MYRDLIHEPGAEIHLSSPGGSYSTFARSGRGAARRVATEGSIGEVFNRW